MVRVPGYAVEQDGLLHSAAIGVAHAHHLVARGAVREEIAVVEVDEAGSCKVGVESDSK